MNSNFWLKSNERESERERESFVFSSREKLKLTSYFVFHAWKF